MTGSASARFASVGHKRSSAACSLGLTRGSGGPPARIDELEDDAPLLGLAGDQPLRADAGAHLSDVAPAVEPDLVQPVIALAAG